ncbi:sel1 repeat family protein [Acinetobacter indicus]|nr:tetratricopeptide repeat protein [Acinetobacter indicus]QIC72349.1 sel1 repeat family protein [Acinetobacter indicus]
MKLSKKILISFTLGLCINPAFADQNFFNATEISAKKGDMTAQYNLGVMYANGQGVTQNYSKAFEWYSRAAAQGDADAQYRLGLMYASGQGVTQNYSKA